MAIRIFVKCKKHQSHNCRLDCRHFLKQLATLLFSSSPCPCPSQSPEAHIYQLTVNRTHCCSFSKVIDFHIAVSVVFVLLYQLQDQAQQQARQLGGKLVAGTCSCPPSGLVTSVPPTEALPTLPPPPSPNPDVKESIAAGECNSEQNECCIDRNFCLNSIQFPAFQNCSSWCTLQIHILLSSEDSIWP